MHDNPALCRTVELATGKSSSAKKQPVGMSSTSTSSSSGILPVFIFDTSRFYGSETRSEFGSQKCGPRRAKFALEAVADLRNSLQKKGSGLVVAVGKPEIVLAEIAKSYTSIDGTKKINIVCQEEVCSEELAVNKAVRSELEKSMTKGNKFNF